MGVNDGWTLIEGPGNMWQHEGGRVVAGRDGQTIAEILKEIETDPPPPPPPGPLIALPAEVLFFDRMTDGEYDDLDASVRAGESARIYRGWAAATSFVEGTDLWALLDKHLALVVSAARKSELLASA